VDEAVMQDFRKSLDEANILHRRVGRHATGLSQHQGRDLVDAFGRMRRESAGEAIAGGQRARTYAQAKALAENAKKIVAEHNAAPAFNR